MNVEYLIPITVALVEVVKKTGRVPNNFLPLLSLVFGLVLGYFNDLGWMLALLVGLGASGTYDILKEPVHLRKE